MPTSYSVVHILSVDEERRTATEEEVREYVEEMALTLVEVERTERCDYELEPKHLYWNEDLIFPVYLFKEEFHGIPIVLSVTNFIYLVGRRGNSIWNSRKPFKPH